mgnify:CR=1 FL=1
MLIENDWILTLFYLVILMLFVTISDVLYKKMKISGKITRRFVHVGVGLAICTTPFLLDNWLPPLLLAGIFIIANSFAIKNKMMSGIHSANRISYGTVFFPISYMILILIFWNKHPEIIVISMLLLTISDPIAAIIGEKYGESFTTFLHDKKSFRGLIGVFVSSFLLTLGAFFGMAQYNYINYLTFNNILIISLAVATIAVPAEAISIKGTDNLSLPLLTASMLSIMLPESLTGNLQNLAWILLAVGVAILAYRLKALSKSGAAGAIVVGAFIFTIGGIAWLLPLALFFVLSSILSKLGRDRKKEVGKIVLKGGQRDISQVYANGGVGLVLALIYHFVPHPLFYIMYLGSLAAANADTWETEIGTFFQQETYNVVDFKKVPPGTSGGISFMGTIGGLAGSAIIAVSGIIISNFDATYFVFITILVSGILGSILDSYAGALFQAEYTCFKCRQKTEHLKHCNEMTELTAGFKWINNDMVNFICTLSGSIIVLLIYNLIGHLIV